MTASAHELRASALPLPEPAHPLGTVLLLEEYEPLRFAIGMVLQTSGYDVLAAVPGREAVCLAEDYRPEVVLIDLASGGLDAWWVAGMIRRHPRTGNVPIVAILSGSSKVDTSRARAAGFTAVLTKPFGARELLDTVNRCRACGPPEFPPGAV